MASGTVGAARFEELSKQRLLAEFSLWSADLTNLAADIERAEGLADIHHLDVADGVFAPALLFFPDLVAQIRKRTTTPLHVHLMADDAILASQAEQFAEAGADLISVHVENGQTGLDVLDRLRGQGVRTGVVLRVETEVGAVAPYLADVDMITLLGTKIGVKGQDLDPKAGDRLREAGALLEKAGRRDEVLLAADGGIREHTVPLLREAGANTVVMGSLAFGAKDLPARIDWLRAL